MKFNIIITSWIVSYAAANSIPETAYVADLEARKDHIGELCTAPIVCPPYVIPVFIFSLSQKGKKNEKEMI
jgi:hypothetical protein